MNPPSGDARELVRGGVDLHVHISPDVIERRIDDVSLAHIRSLDPKVKGNQSFLLSTTGKEGYTVSLY